MYMNPMTMIMSRAASLLNVMITWTLADHSTVIQFIHTSSAIKQK